MKKFKNCHIWYLIISILLIAAGILLFPELTGLGWGESIISLIVAAILLVYFIYVIIPSLNKFANSATEVKVMIILETLVISFLMVSSVLEFFQVFSALDIHQVTGIALWIRGVSLIVQDTHGRHAKMGVFAKYIYILLVSLGVFILFNSYINEKIILYSVCGLFFLVALILIIYTIVYWPKTKKVKKEKSKKVTKR